MQQSRRELLDDVRTHWLFLVAVVFCAALAGWGAMRAERLFTQAWNDYHEFQDMRRDFPIMRAWIIQQNQPAQHR